MTRGSVIDTGAVVEFERFTFEQFEIRDTDLVVENSNVVGTFDTGKFVYFRANDPIIMFSHRLLSGLSLSRKIETKPLGPIV